MKKKLIALEIHNTLKFFTIKEALELIEELKKKVANAK